MSAEVLYWNAIQKNQGAQANHQAFAATQDGDEVDYHHIIAGGTLSK